MSSSEQDRIRGLAERVARRLGDAAGQAGVRAGDEGGDLAALRASLSQIQRRLEHIESHLTHGESCEHDSGADQGRQEKGAQQRVASAPTQAARSTWLSGTYVPAVSHPSQEQFTGIGEAVSELVDFFEREKICTVEPGGKPCDQCGMCSARGF